MKYVEDPKIRALRVQTWFRAVQAASGGRTPAQLEREFSERANPMKMLPRSCIWEKYRRGAVAPRDGKRSDGRQNLVLRVEERYPGTARWLRLPIWRLADSAPMTMQQIREIYSELPRLMRVSFVAQGDAARGLFWRRAGDPAVVCRAFASWGTLDAIAVLLTMVKEAEITQDQTQHRVCTRTIRSLLTDDRPDSLERGLRMGLHAYLDTEWRNAIYEEDDPRQAVLRL